MRRGGRGGRGPTWSGARLRSHCVSREAPLTFLAAGAAVCRPADAAPRLGVAPGGMFPHAVAFLGAASAVRPLGTGCGGRGRGRKRIKSTCCCDFSDGDAHEALIWVSFSGSLIAEGGNKRQNSSELNTEGGHVQFIGGPTIPPTYCVIMRIIQLPAGVFFPLPSALQFHGGSEVPPAGASDQQSSLEEISSSHKRLGGENAELHPDVAAAAAGSGYTLPTSPVDPPTNSWGRTRPEPSSSSVRRAPRSEKQQQKKAEDSTPCPSGGCGATPRRPERCRW